MIRGAARGTWGVVARLAAVGAGSFLAACGSANMSGGAESKSPPPPPAETAPTRPATDETELSPRERELHIADALGELRESERMLEVQVERRKAPKPSPPKPAPATPESATRPTTPPGRSDDDRSPCEVACVALGSMRRSSAYVCKLAGATEPRCVEATERVRRAEERIATACGACPPSSPVSWLDELAPPMSFVSAND